MRPRKVNFPGHGIFWFRPDEDDNESGPLAPLHHCDEKGQILDEFVFKGDSYAHVFSGAIMRYGKPIGNLEDLEEVHG